MKRIFVPTKSGGDWQRLLAKPDLHWKSGASAMTAAASWEAARSSLPEEISKLFDSTTIGALVGQQLLIAIPEWEVELEGGKTASSTDVLAICHNRTGLCVIAVEAKVLEDFGPLLGEKRKQASEGQDKRLQYLHRLLGVPKFDDSIRYQLLHRAASALLTARDFHAAAAVMLVHAFGTPPDRRKDFQAFAAAMKAVPAVPSLYVVPQFSSPALYFAWCEGDAQFLTADLRDPGKSGTRPIG